MVYLEKNSKDEINGVLSEVFCHIPPETEMMGIVEGETKTAKQWLEYHITKKDPTIATLGIVRYAYGKIAKYRIWCSAGGLYGEV